MTGIGRREFIAASAGSLAFGGAFAGVPEAGAQAPAGRPLVRFGIVTDPHSGDLDAEAPPHEVRAYRESPRKMREFVERMNASQVDFVVELGDFAEYSATMEARLRNLDEIEKVFRGFRGPTYHVIGNHDLQSMSRDVFARHVTNTGIPPESVAHYSFAVGGVTFVVLDHGYFADGTRMEPGGVDWERGNLGPDERQWLVRTLAEAPGKVVVFSHWRLDPESRVPHGLQAEDAASTREILEKSRKVIASFNGHHHHGSYNHLNGIGYYGLRAMCTGHGDAMSGYAEVAIYPSGGVSVTGFRKARSVRWEYSDEIDDWG